jgi:hypothetical protein
MSVVLSERPQEKSMRASTVLGLVRLVFALFIAEVSSQRAKVPDLGPCMLEAEKLGGLIWNGISKMDKSLVFII